MSAKMEHLRTSDRSALGRGHGLSVYEVSQQLPQGTTLLVMAKGGPDSLRAASAGLLPATPQ